LKIAAIDKLQVCCINGAVFTVKIFEHRPSNVVQKFRYNLLIYKPRAAVMFA